MSLALTHQPLDIISRVLYSDSTHLLVSSWDKTISLCNTQSNSLLYSHSTEAPILDCAFLEAPNQWAYGGLEKRVHLFDLVAKKDTVIGSHTETVKAICVSNGKSGSSGAQPFIVSGAWDKSVKFLTANTGKEEKRITVGGKVYAMSLAGDYLAVGTEDKSVYAYDIRKLPDPLITKPTGFTMQIRTLAWTKNAEGFVVASAEGRVAVEYVNNKDKKPYTFKCHRVTETTPSAPGEPLRTLIYPINSLCINPVTGQLATAGSDATVCMWDVDAKKRLSKLQLTNSVQSVCFSEDGKKLAIGCSYNGDGGVKEKLGDVNMIFVKNLTESTESGAAGEEAKKEEKK